MSMGKQELGEFRALQREVESLRAVVNELRDALDQMKAREFVVEKGKKRG